MIIQQITKKFGVQNDRNFMSSPLEASALLHLKWFRCERLASDKKNNSTYVFIMLGMIGISKIKHIWI